MKTSRSHVHAKFVPNRCFGDSTATNVHRAIPIEVFNSFASNCRFVVIAAPPRNGHANHLLEWPVCPFDMNRTLRWSLVNSRQSSCSQREADRDGEENENERDFVGFISVWNISFWNGRQQRNPVIHMRLTVVLL